MHDGQLHGITAAVVVRRQPVGDADALRRLLAVPAVEMDGKTFIAFQLAWKLFHSR